MHTIAGTKLTDAQYKLILRLRKQGLATVPTVTTLVRRNRFTGVSHHVNQLEAILFDWIVNTDRGDRQAAGTEDKATWDAARMMYRMLWPDHYYDLID